ncbi:MAG: hypothetical protein AB8B65_12900 [Kordia sp.]|uniref:hypothetical protein n=1 Tax=Kordia sp. TaxID=1965332 RepID=UPI0038590CD1
MMNYKLKYGVAEVAKMLEIEKQVIKEMSYHFREYLNPNANPEKGTIREFTVNDIYALSYIYMYWEEEPDYKNISYGLNSYEHFEYPYSEISTEAKPIFREFSNELIDTNVWMIGGMAECSDILMLAKSYKKAGDLLINIGIEDETERGIIYPVIYNYRHATELYLKSLIKKEKETHNLKLLYEIVRELLVKKVKVDPSKWFENLILAFDDFDPYGTTFRYAVPIKKDEMFIDLVHIKKLMSWFDESIVRIKNRITE